MRLTRRGWAALAVLGVLLAYVAWVYVFRWYVTGAVWLWSHR